LQGRLTEAELTKYAISWKRLRGELTDCLRDISKVNDAGKRYRLVRRRDFLMGRMVTLHEVYGAAASESRGDRDPSGGMAGLTSAERLKQLAAHHKEVQRRVTLQQQLEANDVARFWKEKQITKHLEEFHHSTAWDKARYPEGGSITPLGLEKHIKEWRRINTSYQGCLHNSRFNEAQKQQIMYRTRAVYEDKYGAGTEACTKALAEVADMLMQQKRFTEKANQRLIDTMRELYYAKYSSQGTGGSRLKSAIATMPTWVVGNHDEDQIHEAQAPLDRLKDIQHRREWDLLSSGQEEYEAEALAGAKQGLKG
jgi:hypothetical protein